MSKGKITRVRKIHGGFNILAMEDKAEETIGNSFEFNMSSEHGVIPVVGDIIETHTYLGCHIRSVDINGKCVFTNKE